MAVLLQPYAMHHFTQLTLGPWIDSMLYQLKVRLHLVMISWDH